MDGGLPGSVACCQHLRSSRPDLKKQRFHNRISHECAPCTVGRYRITLLGFEANRSMDAEITPEGSLEVLSQLEVSHLRDIGDGSLGDLFRLCTRCVK